MARRLEAAEYTVGWVCALPIELAVAQEMFDERHAAFPRDDSDPNIYTLGRIGNHNVVLTCLPAGQTGIGPAATGATRMLLKFTSIRFGLMVGVGSGVPGPTSDIRLGDIVVSQPSKHHGGIVQYDSGKAEKDGHVTRTGSLNTPPTVLLSAVSQLQANQYTERTNLRTHLTALSHLSRFKRDTAGSDVLFEASYKHSGEATCERCCTKREISRTVRRDGEDFAIHYGTIASGNQVIKDGITRDRLSEQLGGVLCFEMEAAGLMNEFPCLVVRGICDYADSHKSKSWQPYAAATAAACAKEILLLVPTAVPVVPETFADEAAEKPQEYHIAFSLKNVPIGKFADRPRDMKAVEQALLPQQPTRERRMLVLHGLGGIGKTQIAADFARRNRHHFSSVLWLDGSSKSSLKQSIATYSSSILSGRGPENSQSKDPNTAVEEFLDWLNISDNNNWLIVIDNVDRDNRRRQEDVEAYNIEDYLPEADHGSVLITTRLPHLGQLGERWEVTKVDKKCARAIFETCYGGKIGQEGNELLGLLDGLPLALAQAASYMNEAGTNFSTYTRLYKDKWRELMGPRFGKDMPLWSYHNGSVATTWMISYEEIREKSRVAANLLLLWSHLDNKSLWYELLTIAPRKSTSVEDRLSAYLGNVSHDEIEFLQAIAMLRSYSLVEAMEDQTDCYAMHPVVHQWALHAQDKKQQSDLSWLAITIVGLAVPFKNEKRFWEMQMRLLPHAERCGKRVHNVAKYKPESRGLKKQKEEHETLLRAVHKLGSLYTDREMLNEAEKMLMYALAGREEALGAQHFATLNTINDIGHLYANQGKFHEAEKMYLRSLEGKKRLLGADHTSTLETVNNLGLLYTDQGKHDKAEKMYMWALRGREKALGAEHVSTINIVNNLGLLYAALDQREKAEIMYVRALDVYTKALEPEHIWTLNTVNNLGALYADWGKLDKAEKMYYQALELKEKTLGAYHTSTLNTVNDLGLLYTEQGKLCHAEEMYVRALEGYMQVLGAEHTWTLNTINNLGALYDAQRKPEESEKMYMQALEGYQKVMGAENLLFFIPALNTMWGLAYLFSNHGRVEDAGLWYLKALSGYQKVFGEGHPRCQTLRDDIEALAGREDKDSIADDADIVDGGVELPASL